MQETLDNLITEYDRKQDPDQQQSLAAKIQALCSEHPTEPDRGQIRKLTHRLIRAPDEGAQVPLARALYDISVANREGVIDVADDCLRFLVVEDPVSPVASCLGRVAGEGITADPGSFGRTTVEFLNQLVDHPEKTVRHSVAWAYEKLAFGNPHLVSYNSYVESLLRDSYPPVIKHACRTCANIARGTNAGQRVPSGSLLDHWDADEKTVRTAAGMALGASGKPEAIEYLWKQRDLVTESEAMINIRNALREATFPTYRQYGDALAIEGDPSPGDWVELYTSGSAPRTGRYRGVYQPLVDGDRKSGYTVTNPCEGYVITVDEPDCERGAEYSDRRQTDAMPLTTTGMTLLDENLLALMYALEGDTLHVELEKKDYAAVVDAVEARSTSRRVIASDDDGNTIELRPCSPEPLLVRFHQGRCFEAERVVLKLRERPASIDPGNPESE